MEELKEYKFDGYKLEAAFCREKGRHGGTTIFSRDEKNCVQREDITSISAVGVFECCAIRCMEGNTKYIIISLYRSCSQPANDMDLFFEKLV